MTREEAIKDIQDNILPVVGGKSLQMAIEALATQGYASERYADLCEYFDGCSDKGAVILHDRNEFKKWLERMRWHVEECDRLSKELDALKAQDAKNAKPMPSQLPSGDTIYRQDAIDTIFSEPLYKSGMKKRDADAVVPTIYEKIKSLPSAQPDVAEKLYQCKCYITDQDGLQHEVIHAGDIRRVTGWEI